MIYAQNLPESLIKILRKKILVKDFIILVKTCEASIYMGLTGVRYIVCFAFEKQNECRRSFICYPNS